MNIEKLTEFAESVDVNGSNTDGLDIKSGFPLKLQPARQWFNWLFNKHSKKINEIIDSLKQAVEELNLGKLDTDANAASASKLNTPCKINGVDFDGAADINLPLIGIGQTWQDVSALRFDGVTYTNTSPRTRTVFFGGGRQGAPAAEFHVGDEIFALWGGGSEPDEVYFSVPIPPGVTYGYKNKPQYSYVFRELI